MAASAPQTGDDLARLRAIAEEGRQRPLLGGHSLVVWGSAIALANLLHWAIVGRVLRLPFWSISLMWFAVTGGAALLATALWRRESDGGAALSTGNRVSRAVWTMGGTFLGTLAVGLVIFAAWASRGGDTDAWLLLSVMPPVTFGVYGVALAATAVAGQAEWLNRYAFAALGFTVGTAALIGRGEQFLLAALGAAVVSVLPGLRLLRTGGRG